MTGQGVGRGPGEWRSREEETEATVLFVFFLFFCCKSVDKQDGPHVSCVPSVFVTPPPQSLGVNISELKSPD